LERVAGEAVDRFIGESEAAGSDVVVRTALDESDDFAHAVLLDECPDRQRDELLFAGIRIGAFALQPGAAVMDRILRTVSMA